MKEELKINIDQMLIYNLIETKEPKCLGRRKWNVD